MKIARIFAHRVELPLVEGSYKWSGGKSVTVFDSNPLYATPIPYTITYEVPTPIQLLWNVILVNNPLIPSNATTLVQNALVAAVTGQSSVIPPPPRAPRGLRHSPQRTVVTGRDRTPRGNGHGEAPRCLECPVPRSPT